MSQSPSSHSPSNAKPGFLSQSLLHISGPEGGGGGNGGDVGGGPAGGSGGRGLGGDWGGGAGGRVCAVFTAQMIWTGTSFPVTHLLCVLTVLCVLIRIIEFVECCL